MPKLNPVRERNFLTVCANTAFKLPLASSGNDRRLTPLEDLSLTRSTSAAFSNGVKVLILFFLLVFLLLIPNPSAFTESITLTTYYPSPHGVYAELRAQQMALGVAYYDQAVYPTIDANADLIVEGRVGIGMLAPTESLEIPVGGILRVGDTMIDDDEINRYTNDTLLLGNQTTFAVVSVPNFTAPLMWDGDDPNFFVDPAGISVLNTIDLAGVQRNNWTIKEWKLASCVGSCTPTCGTGWSLITDILVGTTHVGLCKED